jgi:hypothetical protein
VEEALHKRALWGVPRALRERDVNEVIEVSADMAMKVASVVVNVACKRCAPFGRAGGGRPTHALRAHAPHPCGPFMREALGKP